MSKENSVQELSDDIEVVGPGQMLAQARENAGLSQQQVADKLNFRKTLVKDIENENFDQDIPATFNRGYLRNYAKLVEISVDEVLASYEMLNIAQKQCAELQSFSKGTEKQAESNRIMWISYFILALLIASSVVWWLQETQSTSEITVVSTQSKTEFIQPAQPKLSVENPVSEKVQDKVTDEVVGDNNNQIQVPLAETLINSSIVDVSSLNDETSDAELSGNVTKDNVADKMATDLPADSSVVTSNSDVQFTFSGDCWVNIYDAAGERLAWGIKKTGYVMTITGQAPFNITLGKPELVTIEYQDNTVDISQFKVGVIAKFSLPLQ